MTRALAGHILDGNFSSLEDMLRFAISHVDDKNLFLETAQFALSQDISWVPLVSFVDLFQLQLSC
jgi:hypothetical protein